MRKSQILKGSVELAILGLLARESEMYGYRITQFLKKKENEPIFVNEGTLYPLLLRLEADGFVKSRWAKGTGKRKIHWYAITRKGRRELAEGRTYWAKMTAAVNRLIRAPA